MAYMNQQRKAERAPAIKAILKKYGQKGSLSVQNYSTLRLKVKDAAGMFAEEFLNADSYKREYGINVNPYWIKEHFGYNPKAVEMLEALTEAMYGSDYYDDSDSQIDYFSTSHYIDIDILPA